MNRLILLAFASLLLASCSSNTESSVGDTESTQTTTTTAAVISSVMVETTTSAVSDSEPKNKEYKAITAEITGYKDGKLEFTYEGQEYKVPCSRESFEEDSPTNYPTLTERIIYNKFGETVKGKLRISEDMSEITKCDVFHLNGIRYTGSYCFDQNMKVVRDKLYTFKRSEGSMCTVSNCDETVELDLNDLEMYYKYDYTEDHTPVTFDCFKFKDGKMFLYKLRYFSFATDTDLGEDSRTLTKEQSDWINNRLCFFGTVKSIADDGKTLTFMLNDKKTLCTVPTYYNDGTELKEGMEIMATLRADGTLFGSGGEQEFDYAVISADPVYYNQTGIKDKLLSYIITVNGENSTGETIPFDELAYAEYSGVVHFKYTTVGKAGVLLQ